jgi:transcriptional regulator with XRE-family HTH domain
MSQPESHKNIPFSHTSKSDMTFGAVVRSLRDKQGLSQEDLADYVGVEQSWVSKLESDKIDPPLSKVSAIADALGVSKSQLFGIAERTMTIEIKSIVVENGNQLVNTNSVNHFSQSPTEVTAYQEHIADLRKQVEDLRTILHGK